MKEESVQDYLKELEMVDVILGDLIKDDNFKDESGIDTSQIGVKKYIDVLKKYDTFGTEEQKNILHSVQRDLGAYKMFIESIYELKETSRKTAIDDVTTAMITVLSISKVLKKTR